MLQDANSFWSFEMKIIGYQYNDPEEVSGLDSRWLRQHFKVSFQEKDWQWTSASLFFEEVPQLIDWLRAIANSQDVKSSIDFLEPDIRFELVATDKSLATVRVCLARDWGYRKHSFKERWKASTHTEYETDEVCQEFTVYVSDLVLAAGSLVDDLRKLPPRAGIDVASIR